MALRGRLEHRNSTGGYVEHETETHRHGSFKLTLRGTDHLRSLWSGGIENNRHGDNRMVSGEEKLVGPWESRYLLKTKMLAASAAGSNGALSKLEKCPSGLNPASS